MWLKPIYRALTDIYNWMLPLIVINILWLFMSFTVILLPPATAALYEIAHLAARGEGPRVGRFLEAVRYWGLKSWLWGLPIGFLLLSGFIALNVYGGMNSPLRPALVFITAACLLMLSMTQFYFWPYVLLQDAHSLKRAARNALLTALGAPLLTLLHVSLALFAFILGVVFIAPLIFIVPVLIAFVGVYSLRDWLIRQGLLDSPRADSS